MYLHVADKKDFDHSCIDTLLGGGGGAGGGGEELLRFW